MASHAFMRAPVIFNFDFFITIHTLMIFNKLRLTAVAALMSVASLSFIAEAESAPEKPWKLVNAEELRIINKAWPAGVTERKYSRLPAAIKDSVRSTLWDRQQCSSGIGVRFATNSSRIGVKYKLFLNTHMIHMTDYIPTDAELEASFAKLPRVPGLD